MTTDTKFLFVAMIIASAAIVFRVSPFSSILMILILLAVVYVVGRRSD